MELAEKRLARRHSLGVGRAKQAARWASFPFARAAAHAREFGP